MDFGEERERQWNRDIQKLRDEQLVALQELAQKDIARIKALEAELERVKGCYGNMPETLLRLERVILRLLGFVKDAYGCPLGERDCCKLAREACKLLGIEPEAIPEDWRKETTS